MWKLSLLWKMSFLNVTAVEIEIAELIEPAVKIEIAVLIEPAVEIEPDILISAGSISTSLTLKSVILFLFDFLKSSCLGKKDSHFCLVYGKVYIKKISISILCHERDKGSFPGLNFHITDVEIEPSVLIGIPPLRS